MINLTIIEHRIDGTQKGRTQEFAAPFDPVRYLREHPYVQEVYIENVEEPDCAFCLNRDQVKPEYL